MTTAGGAAAFVDFGGQGCGGLGGEGGEGGEVEFRGVAQAGDDAVVEAAHADLRVGLVDHREAGRVQGGDGAFEGDGLAGADLAGEHADGPVVDAPRDAGGCLAV
nr:hypothetical protein [Streptacidiphilus jeojiense]